MKVLALFGVLVAALVLIAAAVSAAAIEPQGAGTTVGTSSQAADPVVSQLNVTAGNVTENNISSNLVTAKWAGFYGSFSGSFILADSSNNFYEWTASDLTGGVIYAANDSVTWGAGEWLPMNATGYPSYLAVSTTDNFTNTFNETETFSSPDYFSAGIANAPYAETFNYTGGRSGLKTYALIQNSTDQTVYAANVIDNANGFNNLTLDYQLLVPANSLIAYYFYLELP